MSPCLFNLYKAHIIRNAELDELQAGIEIGRRNIKNLRYADDTTLMAERKEKLKSLSMKVKEEGEKVSLKLNIKKKKKRTKILTSTPITPRQKEGEKVETVTDVLLLGSKITMDGDCRHEIRRRLLIDS